MSFSARLSLILWHYTVAQAELLRHFDVNHSILVSSGHSQRLSCCGKTASRAIGEDLLNLVSHYKFLALKVFYFAGSVNKRLFKCLPKEHHARRAKSQTGILPFLTGDVTFNDASQQQQAVQYKYKFSSHLHNFMATKSNFGHWHGDEAVSKDGAPSAHSAPKSIVRRIGSSQNSSPGLRRPRAEHISLTSASIQPDSIEFSTTQRTSFINLYGPQGLVPTAPVESASSDQYSAAACQMEDTATAQRLSCGSKRSGHIFSTEECANGNAPAELKTLGQSRRPSPLSSLRSWKQNITHVKHGALIIITDIFTVAAVNFNVWPSCVPFLEASHILRHCPQHHCCSALYPTLTVKYLKVHFSNAWGRYISIVCLRISNMDNFKWHYQITHLLRSPTSSYFAARAQHHINIAHSGLQIGPPNSSQHDHFASAYFMQIALRFAHRLFRFTVQVLHPVDQISSRVAMLHAVDVTAARSSNARFLAATFVLILVSDHVKALWEYEQAHQLYPSILRILTGLYKYSNILFSSLILILLSMSLRKFRLSTLKKYKLFGFRTTRELLSQYEARGHKSQQAPLFAVTDFSQVFNDNSYLAWSLSSALFGMGASQKRS